MLWADVEVRPFFTKKSRGLEIAPTGTRQIHLGRGFYLHHYRTPD